MVMKKRRQRSTITHHTYPTGAPGTYEARHDCANWKSVNRLILSASTAWKRTPWGQSETSRRTFYPQVCSASRCVMLSSWALASPSEYDTWCRSLSLSLSLPLIMKQPARRNAGDRTCSWRYSSFPLRRDMFFQQILKCYLEYWEMSLEHN